MDTFRDDNRFNNFFFFKDKLEKQLGISLTENEANNLFEKDEPNILPTELEPYKSRITINSWDAASLIANNHPDADWSDPTVISYKNSILNAVKNNVLASKELDYDINNELCYAEIYTKDIGLWAKKHNYNWPLPIDDETEETNQNNNELLSRIKQLEQDLEEQKKINDEYVEVPFYESQEAFLEAYKQGKISSPSTNNEKLIAENTQLKNDNQKLVEQLEKAKKETEELKKQVPILLGQYKKDDPLLLAIQVRNQEWANYNHSTGKGKASQAGIIAELMKKYKISEKKAIAIELVANPIDRG